MSCCFAHIGSAKSAVIFYAFCSHSFSQCQRNRNKTFTLEYFDRGISKSFKGVTDEVKCKNCAAVIKCTGGLASKMQTFYGETKFDTIRCL